MAKFKVAQTYAGQVNDAQISPTLINGSHVGGVGGLTSQTGQQIQPTVFVTGGSQTTGSILGQKAARKFRVTDGTNTGVCTLTNAYTLAAGQMSIQVNLESILSANIAAANVVTGATESYVTYATANVSGPVAIAIGQRIFGFSGNAADATVTAINTTVAGLANVTVSVTGNVAAETVTVDAGVYAARITNKFAHGYDGTKYRYHLATPDATFVQVKSA